MSLHWQGDSMCYVRCAQCRASAVPRAVAEAPVRWFTVTQIGVRDYRWGDPFCEVTFRGHDVFPRAVVVTADEPPGNTVTVELFITEPEAALLALLGFTVVPGVYRYISGDVDAVVTIPQDLGV